MMGFSDFTGAPTGADPTSSSVISRTALRRADFPTPDFPTKMIETSPQSGEPGAEFGEVFTDMFGVDKEINFSSEQAANL